MANEICRPMIEKKRVKHRSHRMNPNSLANLKPYLPGTNGHGRVYPLKERLRHALDHPLVVPKADAPAGDHLVYATLKGAIDLVPPAFHEAWDRTEGKVRDDTPQGFQDNRQYNILVVNDEAKQRIERLLAGKSRPSSTEIADDNSHRENSS